MKKKFGWIFPGRLAELIYEVKDKIPVCLCTCNTARILQYNLLRAMTTPMGSSSWTKRTHGSLLSIIWSKCHTASPLFPIRLSCATYSLTSWMDFT